MGGAFFLNWHKEREQRRAVNSGSLCLNHLHQSIVGDFLNGPNILLAFFNAAFFPNSLSFPLFFFRAGIFPATWTPSQKVEATARVGATGLEINIDANQLWTQRLDTVARRTLHRQAQDAGVTITSLCMNAHWVFNLTSPDVRIRDMGVSLLLDAIDIRGTGGCLSAGSRL
jgi:hypothetical protein